MPPPSKLSPLTSPPAEIKSDLLKIYGTKRGKEIIDGAIREGDDLTIVIYPHYGNGGGLKNGKHGLVIIDPDLDHYLNGFPDKAGKPTRFKVTLIRSLAHELGHALTGIGDTPFPGDQMDNVRKNENPILQQLGEPARASY
jgi:hypothetical protein